MAARIIEGGLEGYWTPRTSTLDWCEENFTALFHIAEFWNTASNLGILILAISGLLRFLTLHTELRFLVTYLSFGLIGIGSSFFHATLRYECQLMDEIPMLICISSLAYCVIEKGNEQRYGNRSVLAIPLFSIISTITYIQIHDPIFHHTLYALISIFVMFETIRISISSRTSYRARKLLWQGAGTYVIAFGFWVIDNLYCDHLRGIRISIRKMSFDLYLYDGIAILVSSLFQFHAWWHLLSVSSTFVISGLGGYFIMVFLEYDRLKMGKFEVPKSSNKEKKHFADAYLTEIIEMKGRYIRIGISFWCFIIPYPWAQLSDKSQ